MARSLHVGSEAAWLALRQEHVGASEVAALFGVSPYETHFGLWVRKSGHVPPRDIALDRRIMAGKHLEPAIADLVAEIHGLTIRKTRRYLVHDDVSRMGASLDYEILEPVAGSKGTWVPFEIKNVGFDVFRDWKVGHDDDGRAEIEPPLHIDLQVQHQLAVTGAPVGYVGVLVGGNEPHLIRRERHAEIIKQIEARVAAFWTDVDAKREPVIDYERDLAALSVVRANGDGELDLRGNSEAEALVAMYADAKRREKAAAEIAESCRAQALAQWGDKVRVVLGNGSVALKVLPAEPGGEEVRVRQPKPQRREVRIYPKKEK